MYLGWVWFGFGARVRCVAMVRRGSLQYRARVRVRGRVRVKVRVR